MANTYHRRMALAEAQNHRCCYCGKRFGPDSNMLTGSSIEHVIRLADGGAKTWENEVAACRRCNSNRGAMHALAYYYMVSKTGSVPPKRRQYRPASGLLRQRDEYLQKWRQDLVEKHEVYLASLRAAHPPPRPPTACQERLTTFKTVEIAFAKANGRPLDCNFDPATRRIPPKYVWWR